MTNSFRVITTTTAYFGNYTVCGIKRAKSATTTTITTHEVAGVTPTTQSTFVESVPPITPTPAPTCSFGVEDCNELWFDYASAEKEWEANSGAEIWTISLAKPPDRVTANGVTKTLTSREGYAPTLTIGTHTYPALTAMPSGNATEKDSIFYDLGMYWADRTNLRRATLSPGMSVTWSLEVHAPASPLCSPSFTAGAGGFPCEIRPADVQLLYLPVPTTVRRDICATAPTEGWVTSLPTDISQGEHLADVIYPLSMSGGRMRMCFKNNILFCILICR